MELSIIAIVALLADVVMGDDLLGAAFVKEPPNVVYFSNMMGVTIECLATGVPSPRITWQTETGSPVDSLPGLRQVLPGGELKFLPFKGNEFHKEIHSATYRCSATNLAGTIVSRNVRVKAVIQQSYELIVDDVYAAIGTTAVFTCKVPPSLREFIQVTKWLRDEAFFIEPSVILDGKYAVLPSGDLHIRDIEVTDGGSSYRCHVKHKVTGETHFSSSSGKLTVLEPKESMQPKITGISDKVHINEGETVILPCVAEGYPPPQTEWYAKLNKRQLFPLHIGERVQKVSGALIIHHAQTSDSGTYVCDVSNDEGSDRRETTVTVTAQLSVNIVPERQTVDIEKPATFRCIITGFPIHSVAWYKDGQKMLPAEGRVISDEFITIENVHVTDKGMYQCIVSNNMQSAQGAGQLVPGDAVPEFVGEFEENILDKGSNMTLKCVATGSPAPSITWSLDGIPLSSNFTPRFATTEISQDDGSIVGVLNITDIRWEDGGMYRCQASNRAGQAQHSARINIYGPPAVRKMPRVTAVAGASVTLHCPYYGFPIDSITWRKDIRMIPFDLRQQTSPNGTLVIHELQRFNDIGNYSCSVTNSKGETAQEFMELAIAVPPKITPFSFQDKALREGMRTWLQCAVSEGDAPLVLRWTKDGRSLSADDLNITMHALDDYTNILRIGHVAPVHNGNYTCIATNEAASAQYTAQLLVNVPPKIMPFAFLGDQFYVGMRAQITCAVSQGDLPIHFRWLKDGLPLPSSLPIVTRKYDEYSNSLHIESVMPNHTGNYTCIAENAAAVANYSAALLVHVPPRWKIKPEDTSVLLNHAQIIDCQADGFPKPTITWMKARGTTFNINVDPVPETKEMGVLWNGSLHIIKALESHLGYYFCQASNGIGDKLSIAIHLTVLVPPRFELKNVNLTFRRSEKFRLKCEPKGDTPIMFTWKIGDVIIEPTHKKRYDIETLNNSVSQMTLREANRNDTGRYACVAQNKHGIDEVNFHVTMLEPPDAPFKISVHEARSRSVEIRWTAPFDGNRRILKYIIEYSKHSGKDEPDLVEMAVNGKETSTVVQNLKPATLYQLRMFAENEIGLSDPSEFIQFITDEEVPSGKPLGVDAESVDSTTVCIRWKAPRVEMRHGKLRGFHINYKKINSSESSHSKLVEIEEDDVENYTVYITELHKFTQYSFSVTAFNSKGKGPSSEDVTVRTAEDVPSQAPKNFQCNPLTSESIHVTWEAPPSHAIHGILLGYKVLYAKMDYEWKDDLSWSEKKTTVSRTTVHDLDKFTNYTLRVLAYTKAGDGMASNSVSCRTLDDVPDSPANVKALPASKESVMVAWKPPLHPNGVVTKYHVYNKHVNDPQEDAVKNVISPGTTFYEVTGLSTDERYEFWVTAATMIGESQRSKIVTEAPHGPIVPARIAAFDNDFTTLWKKLVKLPCKSVGHPPPDRIWTLKSQTIKENERIRLLPDGMLMIKNVQWSDSGNYTCHVKNGYGEDEVTYVVNILAPPSSPSVYLVETTSTTISLQWKLETDGGTNVQGFTLNYKKELEHWVQADLTPDSDSFTIVNLQCGSQYQIYMTAVNKIGTSSPSEIISVKTNISIPRIPSKEELIVEDMDFVTINFEVWRNEACPISHYVIEFRQKADSNWIVLADKLTAQEQNYVIKNLFPGTFYHLRITAHNGLRHAVASYNFSTIFPLEDTISSRNNIDDERGVLFYLDLRIIIPIAVLTFIVLMVLSTLCFCSSHRTIAARKQQALAKNMPQNGANHFGPESSTDGMTYEQRQRASSDGAILQLEPQEKPVSYASFLIPDLRSAKEFITFGQRNNDIKTNEYQDNNGKNNVNKCSTLQHFSKTPVGSNIAGSTFSLNGRSSNGTLLPRNTNIQSDLMNEGGVSSNIPVVRQPPEVPTKPSLVVMETKFLSSPDKVTCRLIPGPQR